MKMERGFVAAYRYEELSPTQFENLIVDICRDLFGLGVQGFATGPDGGRDARFCGTANSFPSIRDPWIGTTIIQAKHTSRVDASFSDTDFSGKGKILESEIPRITKLIQANDLDHYALFSNRKLTGNNNTKMEQAVSSSCGLAPRDVHIAGIEYIDLHLRDHKSIAERHGLDLLAAPLRITRDGIAEIIDAIRDAIQPGNTVPDDEPVDRTSLERKNELNGISDDEIEPFRRKYLKETAMIKDFLADPINETILKKYNEAVEELNTRLPHLVSVYGDFMGAWHGIYDIMINHNEILRQNPKLVKAVQFYMYWNCDFGRSENDDSAE